MRIIYPSNPLEPKSVEDLYSEEYAAAQSLGIDVAVFDDELWSSTQTLSTKPSITRNETILYRGWMMSPEKYRCLSDEVETFGAQTLTNVEAYKSAHHIDGWYDTCADLTAKTFLVQSREDLAAHMRDLSWERYFIKDFVKSNSGPRGSVAATSDQGHQILDELEMYRGEIEGGIALREYEEYEEDSERRYFVVGGEAFGANDEVPDIVRIISSRLAMPFYSVDIVETKAGQHRLVELGDGQVSDRKEWSASTLAKNVLYRLAHDT